MIDIISNGYPYRPERGCFGYSTIGVITTNKKVLFDTGGYNMRSEIIKLIDKIDYVVISHLHFDHCSNLDLFIESKTPIFMSEIEYIDYKFNKGKDVDFFSYFDEIKEKLNIKLIDKNIFIAENMEIVLTPGHTNGHISLIIHEEVKSIFAGDALKTFSDYQDITKFGNAINKEQYISTKQWIIENFTNIYPGHDLQIKDGRQVGSIEVKKI